MMMYFDDMRDKYGFNDGGATPSGANEYRRAYILAINTLATAAKCAQRAVAYDRPGMHNGTMILFYAVAQLVEAGVNLEELYLDWESRLAAVTPEKGPDEIMEECLGTAEELDIDSLVDVEVEFNPTAFDDWCKFDEVKEAMSRLRPKK